MVNDGYLVAKSKSLIPVDTKTLVGKHAIICRIAMITTILLVVQALATIHHTYGSILEGGIYDDSKILI